MPGVYFGFTECSLCFIVQNRILNRNGDQVGHDLQDGNIILCKFHFLVRLEIKGAQDYLGGSKRQNQLCPGVGKLRVGKQTSIGAEIVHHLCLPGADGKIDKIIFT